MATLGGLIKDYRIQKRLSQLEIATKVGWSDTSRLSKIEQGRTYKPSRAVVEKILDALELSESERNEALLAGSYVPTENEIKKAVRELSEKLNSWRYPAYMIDFTWRVVASNVPDAKTFYIPSNFDFLKNNFNLLEFPFQPKSSLPIEIFKGEDAKTMEPLALAHVAEFKIEQHMRSNETWYQKLISKLMKNEIFREHWSKDSLTFYNKKLLDYRYKEVKGNWTGKRQTLKFHIFNSELVSDPRFIMVLYLPADKETEEFYTKKLYLKVKI